MRYCSGIKKQDRVFANSVPMKCVTYTNTHTISPLKVSTLLLWTPKKGLKSKDSNMKRTNSLYSLLVQLKNMFFGMSIKCRLHCTLVHKSRIGHYRETKFYPFSVSG